jgi:CRP/FNR family transcriptional regulator
VRLDLSQLGREVDKDAEPTGCKTVLPTMSRSSRPFSELLDFLAETDIFYGLPPEQLAAIAQVARLQTFDKRETLFHQGDEGNGFYIVQTGRVKVFQLSASGREQILHVFSPGDHFAEVPAFDGKVFPASAEALEPTTVLFFPRQLFLALLEQTPSLTVNMLKSAARHLRRFSHLIDDLSLKEVPGRLAAHLLTLSEQAGQADRVELSLSKRELAALLGTIPETLSRVLYRLSAEGLIVVEGTQIQLVDREALRDLAQ